MQQTNNRIYNKKQRYMLALKEIAILKSQTEYEVLNEGLDKVHSSEIVNIYNRLIVGLLEEGLKYRYIKDSEDSTKDVVQLKIDNVSYECKNTEIKEILGERYNAIMNIEYDGPSIKEIQESKKNNHSSSEVTSILEDIKQSISEGGKIKKVEPPKIDYIPPKVELKGKDKKLIRKEKGIDKTIKLLVSITITIIILLGCWVAYKSIPGLEEKITSNGKEMINDFKKTLNDGMSDNNENSYKDDENYEQSSETETINVNNISDGIIQRDSKK